MPKILHFADLHLDTPFRCGSPAAAEVRRRELRETFASLIDYIRENDIALALVAGDLFDAAAVTKDTAAFVTAQLASAPSCHFVIAPGNHDPMTPDSVYRNTRFSDNVTVFDRPNLARVSFPALGVDVYGYAFVGSTLETCPAVGQTPKDPSRLNLLCAHADVGAVLSPYAPITEGDLAASGFDYAAFGHVHAYSGLRTAGRTHYAYCGCPEGRDFGETGYKGALLLDIEKENGVLRLTPTWLRFSRRRYEVSEVDLSGAVNENDVSRAIEAHLAASGYGEDTLLRLILRGRVSPSLTCDSRALAQLFGRSLFYLEIEDATLPLYEAAELEKDAGILGAFFAEMRPLLESGTPEERREAARALRIGLAALRGEDFTEIG